MLDRSQQSDLSLSTAAVFGGQRAIDSDAELVRRVQNGDSNAFDALVRKFRERLFSVLYNLTGNREDAADLTQDAFIKAFRSIGNFKGKSSFYTWLYRIAVNGAISHLKRNKGRRFFSFENMNDEEGSAREILEHLTAGSRTEKPTVLKELQERLNEALHKLSVKHRTAVVLHEIDGLTHQEIAEITNTSEGTVRSRLHYAKQQLQLFLKDYLI